jgi:hypothetical protein
MPALENAFRSTLYRNIWGVCARHTLSRGILRSTRPSLPTTLSVSDTGIASKPPTGSAPTSALRRRHVTESMQGRTASCTTIQSSFATPTRPSIALRTVCSRPSPPTRNPCTWACFAIELSNQRSSGASATQIVEPGKLDAMRSIACCNTGFPARDRYCFGTGAP